MNTKRLWLMCFAAALVLAPASLAFAYGRDLPPGRTGLFAQIGRVRRATAAFLDVAAAEANGYAQFLECVSEPGEGAMGIHYVHGELVGDTLLDPLRPEALMYEPQADGRLRLVGVEYIVFQAAWDTEHAAPPQLMGQTFTLVPEPNRYGVPAFYELHLWAWRHNPSGAFYDWNPRVACPAAEPVAWPASGTLRQ